MYSFSKAELLFLGRVRRRPLCKNWKWQGDFERIPLLFFYDFVSIRVQHFGGCLKMQENSGWNLVGILHM